MFFGLVVDEDSRPIEGAVVRSFDARDVRLVARTNASRRFRCPIDSDELSCLRSEQLEVGRVVTRGPQGVFATGPLPPAAYRLEVHAAGFPSSHVDAVRTAKLDGGTIVLSPACNVAILARRFDGKRLLRASVFLTPLSPANAKPIYLGGRPNHAFTTPARPMAAGTYTVTVRASNARTLTYPIRLTPDKTARAVLTLFPK